MPQNNQFNRSSGSEYLPQENDAQLSTILPISEELIHDLLVIHKEEFDLKQREIELREKELSQTHELTLKSIDLHKVYLQMAPRHIFNGQLLFYITLIIILLIVSSVFVYCLYSNNKEIAMRMIELFATAVISGGGGYVYGKNQEKETRNESIEVIE